MLSTCVSQVRGLTRVLTVVKLPSPVPLNPRYPISNARPGDSINYHDRTSGNRSPRGRREACSRSDSGNSPSNISPTPWRARLGRSCGAPLAARRARDSRRWDTRRQGIFTTAEPWLLEALQRKHTRAVALLDDGVGRLPGLNERLLLQHHSLLEHCFGARPHVLCSVVVTALNWRCATRRSVPFF